MRENSIANSWNRSSCSLGRGVHATKPKQILDIDYLYLGRSSKTENYVLVFKDEMSSNFWLVPVDGATSENTAAIFPKQNLVFTASDLWESNQGLSFISFTLKSLAADNHILNKPVVEHSPWANDTVDVFTRITLGALQPLMLMLKLTPRDCKKIMTAILQYSTKRDWKDWVVTRMVHCAHHFKLWRVSFPAAYYQNYSFV